MPVNESVRRGRRKAGPQALGRFFGGDAARSALTLCSELTKAKNYERDFSGESARRESDDGENQFGNCRSTCAVACQDLAG